MELLQKFPLFRAFPWSMTVFMLGLLVVFGWWNSSQYSDRGLLLVGERTVEVFSANSLLRFSLVDGRMVPFERNAFFRHRNAGGSMEFRPRVLSLKRGPGLWNFSMGYWHLLAVVGILLGLTVYLELATLRTEERKAEGGN